MDIEKLTEARSKFIRDNRALIGNNAPLIADAFDACAEALMKMPISERLTEDEKEKIADIMKYPQRYTEPIKGTMHFQVLGIKKVLAEIFGADIFK